MSSEFTNDASDGNEARITALLMGELPDDEAAALRQAIQQDTELAKLHERLARTAGLIRAAAASDEQSEPLQLSPERRAKLFQAFKTIRPRQLAVPRVRLPRREILSMAAMLIILALLATYLMLLSPARRPERVTPIPGLRAGTVGQSPDNVPSGEEMWEMARIESPPSALPPARPVQLGDDVTDFPRDSKRVLSESLHEVPVRAGDREATDLAAREAVRQWAAEAAARGVRVQGGTAPQKMAEKAPAGPEGGGGGFAGDGQADNRFGARGAGVERVPDQKPATEDTLKLSDFLAPYQKVDGDDSGVDPSTSQASAGAHYFKNKSNRAPISPELEGKYKHVTIRFGLQPDAPGTHVAGTVTATTNSILGVAGGVVTDTNGANFGWRFDSTTPGQQTALYYYDANRSLDSFERGAASGTNIHSVNGVGYADVSGELGKTRNLGRTDSAGKEIAGVVINELNYNAPEVASGNKRVEIVLPQLAQENSVYKDEIRDSEDRRKVEVGTLRPASKAPTSAPTNQPVPVDPATGLPIAAAGGSGVNKPSAKPTLKAVESELLVLQQRMNVDKTRNTDSMAQLKSALATEKINLALAELKLHDARRDLERTEKLAKEGLVPASSADANILSYDAAKRNRDNYDLEVKQRKELVSELENDFGKFAEKGILAIEPIDRAVAEAIQVQQKLVKLQDAQKELDEEARKPKAATPAPVPQPEIQTQENPFSTFSLNVSDVSFKLAAASLEKGVLPEPATIRSEEFINAFDYRDPEPAAGMPVAFAWERARYPFAHNRDLLRFSVKTAATGRQAGRPVNLVLLLDNSGSMERADRVNIIRECVRVLGKQLQAEDRISVVAFSRTPRLWIDGLAGTQGGELPQRLGNLAPEGGTNIEEGMNLAYETARRHFIANGINRVVLLTDGAANLGNVEPEALKKKVEAHRKQGIALDCFGIGWEGYNDDLLEVLSRNGDGRYGFMNSPEAAATDFAGQLVGALQVAASDVKVQVEFNPRRVTTYRQIGYAKHQLQKEQFRDNTVDAAEIAAAEAGNALYVIQVDPRGEGPIGVVRVRYKVPGTSDYREHEWSVPASGAVAPLDEAGHAIRLAGVAAAFSEWLASNPFAGEVTPERLLSCLSGVCDVYSADPRPKKLEWMIRQSMSLAGNR